MQKKYIFVDISDRNIVKYVSDLYQQNKLYKCKQQLFTHNDILTNYLHLYGPIYYWILLMFFNLYMDDFSLMFNCSSIGGYMELLLLTIYVTLITCALLVYLPVVCNTCSIFVLSMQLLINYHIMDQSHCHYVSRKHT